MEKKKYLTDVALMTSTNFSMKNIFRLSDSLLLSLFYFILVSVKPSAQRFCVVAVA